MSNWKEGVPISKSLGIVCNDSTHSGPKINVKATPNKKLIGIEREPDRVEYQQVLTNRKALKTVKVMNTGATDAELVIISNPNPELISVKIYNPLLKQNQSTDVQFEMFQQDEVGEIISSVTFEFKNRYETRFTIPIDGEIVEQYTNTDEEDKSKGVWK
ncbi:MAG: hypothetical protein GY855_16445 [candidate division Zixibacteria bacterium]|nr:hypothetical protein [candidate division Zixibacteria bacterium]